MIAHQNIFCISSGHSYLLLLIDVMLALPSIQDTGQPSAPEPAAHAAAASSLPASHTLPPVPPTQASGNTTALPSASGLGSNNHSATAEPSSMSQPDPPHSNAGASIPGVNRPLHVFRRPEAVPHAATSPEPG